MKLVFWHRPHSCQNRRPAKYVVLHKLDWSLMTLAMFNYINISRRVSDSYAKNLPFQCLSFFPKSPKAGNFWINKLFLVSIFSLYEKRQYTNTEMIRKDQTMMSCIVSLLSPKLVFYGLIFQSKSNWHALVTENILRYIYVFRSF